MFRILVNLAGSHMPQVKVQTCDYDYATPDSYVEMPVLEQSKGALVTTGTLLHHLSASETLNLTFRGKRGSDEQQRDSVRKSLPIEQDK